MQLHTLQLLWHRLFCFSLDQFCFQQCTVRHYLQVSSVTLLPSSLPKTTPICGCIAAISTAEAIPFEMNPHL